MKQLLLVFLFFIASYHVLNTWIVFGGGWFDGFMVAVIKDFLWLSVIISLVITYRDGKIIQLGKPLILFLTCCIGIILLISIGVSVLGNASVMSMVVGMKYDILPLAVLGSGMLIGAVGNKKQSIWFQQFSQGLFWLVCAIVLGGWVWQSSKILLPDLFSWFGYGPIGDYLLGNNPPMRYRTGPGGMMRWQGLFSGPNNYGFFLVGMGVFFFLGVKRRVEKVWMQGMLLLLYGGAVVATLSRGALIGLFVAGGLWIILAHKAVRNWLLPVGCVALALLIGLSVLKPGSTLGHSQARGVGFSAFMENPWGYGLGASGPSVHFQGVYLPENQYLGVALDIGIIGFLVWLVFVITVVRAGVSLWVQKKNIDSVVMLSLLLGFVGLLVEGLFLHVFEDSMVNYLVLLPLGVSMGWVLAQLGDDRLQLRNFRAIFSSFDDLPDLSSAGDEKRFDDSFNVGDKKEHTEDYTNK